MHSLIFYIAEHISNKEEFENATDDIPSEESLFEDFNSYADYVVLEDLSKMDRNIDWLQTAYDFFEIKKDDIGFYFEVTSDINKIAKAIYQKIKKEITRLLDEIDLEKLPYNNSVNLWRIAEVANPKTGMHIAVGRDYPESIVNFVLNHGSVKENETIRYYFVASFDYHF